MFKLFVLIFILGQENPQGPFEHEEVFASYTDCMVEATNLAMTIDDRHPEVRAVVASCQKLEEDKV